MANDTNYVFRLNSEDKTIEKVHVFMPKITHPDDVIVRIAFGGICGTDLHIMAGNFPGSPPSLILGHEISGIISEIGSDVTTMKVGTRVAINPMTLCGKCNHCRRGEAEFCKKGSLYTECGIFCDGGWRKYWKVPCRQVEPLPKDLPLELGVLAEPMSCVYKGWLRNGQVEHDSDILIVGSGIIGLLWAALFHSRGYQKVTVSEMSPTRRSLAQNIAPDFKIVIPDYLYDQKEIFDLIIDCSGSTKAISAGFDLLKRRGTMNIFGCAGTEDTVSFKPVDFLLKDLTLVSSLISPYSLPQAMHVLVGLYRQGYLDLGNLGVRIYSVDEKEHAIQDLRNGTVTKAILKM